MRSITYALLSALTLGGAVALAQVETPTTEPSTQPTTSSAAVDVMDLEAIKAAVGKDLTVRGKVSGTFKPRSGSVILINFEGVNRDFVAVVEKEGMDAVNAGFDGDVGKAIEGKTITITGPIKIYREKPEIVISKPEQVKIEE